MHSTIKIPNMIGCALSELDRCRAKEKKIRETALCVDCDKAYSTWHDLERNTCLISAMRSSTAYQANGPYAIPRHQPHKSWGAIYACACRWSFTGIWLSFHGGEIKPTRKRPWEGSMDSGVSAPVGLLREVGEEGVGGGSMEVGSEVEEWLFTKEEGARLSAGSGDPKGRGEGGGRRVERKRCARERSATSKGTSLEDYV